MTQYSGKVIRKTPVTPTQQSASGVWTLTDQAAAIRNNLWPVPGVPDPISRSVRLRSSASAYLSRTPASTTNQKTWTWSAWVKRGALSTYENLFSAQRSGAQGYDSYFRPGDDLRFSNYNGSSYDFDFVTSQVFRDPSAWYHFVFAIDTTQATSTNRVKLYINGVQVTSFSTASYPSQNLNTAVNAAALHTIGRDSTSSSQFDGYLTEINFIDGQALTPSSFGTTDTASGAWIPMPYTGTYGANGFYLNFKDNTSTTTIGYDYSGNSNNWTANNISLTAGTTYDSMLDVPTPWVGYSTTTDTSAVTRGNYCTLNPISTATTLSGGNLDIASLANNYVFASMQVTSGKWYWEYTITGSGSYNYFFGVANSDASFYIGMGMCNGGNSPNSFNILTNTNGTVTSPTGSRPAQPATIGIKLDIGAGSVEFYINGTLNGSVTGITNWPSGNYWTPWLSNYTSTFGYQAVSVNFGQRPFAQSVPAGHKTLCTTNLPTPTITNGANYMAASTYTGNGTSQSIVNSGNNTAAISFKPDLVWVKSRSNVTNHALVDSVRTTNYDLASNSTAAETFSNLYVSALNSNGFSVGSAGDTNSNAATYVGWQWQAGAGTTSSNTSGSITSTVSVNTTAGFSVATFTSPGGSAQTIGHGLGVAPSLIIMKSRNNVSGWNTYHSSVGNTGALNLQTTAATSTSIDWWNNTSPTSSVWTIGANLNISTWTWVAYCWAAVAGYSAFGSYTGNGSADGPFVYCGFRPRWIMLKITSAADSWYMFDTSRDSINVMSAFLAANSSSAEGSVAALDVTANGFKLRSTNTAFNASGGTYIFAAFAENPFKYSNAR